jgi:hypothetical protein
LYPAGIVDDAAYGVIAGASRPGSAQPAALPTLQEQHQQQQQDIVFINTTTQQAAVEEMQTTEWRQQGSSNSSSNGLQQSHASSNGSFQRPGGLPSRSASMQHAQSLHNCVEVRATANLHMQTRRGIAEVCTHRQQAVF